MTYALIVLLGLVLGFALIGVARKLMDQERLVFGLALVGAALWYIGFGLYANSGFAVLLPQLLAGGFFLLMAVLGIRTSVLFLGICWLLHAPWDILGDMYLDMSYAPFWTAPLCLGFDLLVGAYLVMRSRGRFELQAVQTA